MKIAYLLVFISLVFAPLALLAQQKEVVDSLRLRLKAANKPAEEAKIYAALAFEYRSADSAQTAVYASKALRLARQAGDSQTVADALLHIGWATARRANYITAERLVRQSAKVAEEAGYRKGEANAQNRQGAIFYYQGNYPHALEAYLNALKIREEIQDQDGIAGIYNNIGVIYRNQERYQEALEYHQKSLKAMEVLGNTSGVAHNCNNIGNIYYRIGRYPEAATYQERALTLWEELNNASGMSYSYTGLGDVALARQDYAAALDFYQKSLNLAEQLNDRRDIAYCQKDLGKVYLESRQYGQAIRFFQEAMRLSEEVNAPEVTKAGAQGLASAYEKVGNFRKAYQAYKVYKEAADQLLNKENTEEMARMSAAYAFRKEKDSLQFLQERERLAFQEETRRREVVQQATFIGLGLGSLLVLSLLFFYFEKRKSNQQLSAANTETKEVLQLVQVQQEKIQSSLQYARQIQQAILPSEAALTAVFPEHFVLFRPRDVVSGDFYWLSTTHEQSVLAVVDCTGHGVPGAFMSLIGNDLLNAIVNEKKMLNPAHILEELHLGVRTALHQGETQNRDGMDISVVTIDKKSKTLRFAGAKQALVYVQDAQLRILKGDKVPIGGVQREKQRKFTTHTLTFQEDSPLHFYLFSDGYQDQFGGANDRKFMSKRFRKLLYQMYRMPYSQQKQRLEQELDKWKGERSQIDDILVFGARLT